MDGPYSTVTRLAGFLLGLQSVTVFGLWAMYAFKGMFTDGLRTVENNQYLAYHVAAEILMASFLLFGAAGIIGGTWWGIWAGLIGGGAVLYSTMNSLGHSVRNDPRLTSLLAINFVVALVAMILLGIEIA